MEINKSGATLTADKAAVSGAVSYGGALNVTATGDTLAVGDSFTLFTGGSFGGWFSSISVPALTSGNSWDTNKLATTGALDIYAFTTTPLALSTPVNTAAVITAAKLANHTSSGRAANMYPTGWTAMVTTAPANGGSAVVNGDGSLTYTPSAAANSAGNDSFTLTFQDGHGWQTMAVNVTVGSGNGESPNVVYGPTISGGNFVGRFAGIPGYIYTVETNSVLGPGWTKEGNYTAPTDNSQGFGIGVFEVSDPAGTDTSRFYRTVYPSY